MVSFADHARVTGHGGGLEEARRLGTSPGNPVGVMGAPPCSSRTSTAWSGGHPVAALRLRASARRRDARRTARNPGAERMSRPARCSPLLRRMMSRHAFRRQCRVSSTLVVRERADGEGTAAAGQFDGHPATHGIAPATWTWSRPRASKRRSGSIGQGTDRGRAGELGSAWRWPAARRRDHPRWSVSRVSTSAHARADIVTPWQEQEWLFVPTGPSADRWNAER